MFLTQFARTSDAEKLRAITLNKAKTHTLMLSQRAVP